MFCTFFVVWSRSEAKYIAFSLAELLEAPQAKILRKINKNRYSLYFFRCLAAQRSQIHCFSLAELFDAQQAKFSRKLNKSSYFIYF